MVSFQLAKIFGGVIVGLIINFKMMVRAKQYQVFIFIDVLCREIVGLRTGSVFAVGIYVSRLADSGVGICLCSWKHQYASTAGKRTSAGC